MRAWSRDALHTMAVTDDLHIAPCRGDGKTYGTPTWMWSVAVDDARDVRAYNGKHARWDQAALRHKAGRVTAAGITQDVSCEPVNGAIDVALLFRTHGDKERPETSTRSSRDRKEGNMQR